MARAVLIIFLFFLFLPPWVHAQEDPKDKLLQQLDQLEGLVTIPKALPKRAIELAGPFLTYEEGKELLERLEGLHQQTLQSLKYAREALKRERFGEYQENLQKAMASFQVRMTIQQKIVSAVSQGLKEVLKELLKEKPSI